jgi:hypothetical protein
MRSWLIWGIAVAFAWVGGGKLRKMSVRVAGSLAEIWNRDLPNTSQDWSIVTFGLMIFYDQQFLCIYLSHAWNEYIHLILPDVMIETSVHKQYKLHSLSSSDFL